jgi:two-component system, NarL family, response regulator NreC
VDKIKVLIADDHRLFRDGLMKILESCNDIEVIGEASDGQEALKKVEQLNPHVILLDLSMPKLSGLEVARRLKKEHPEIKIVILTMHEEEEYTLKMIRIGVSGYLLKDSAARDVIDAIRNAFLGKAFFSPQVSKILAESYRDVTASEDDPYERLNDREREILQLILEGNTNKEIAGTLFLSPKTVDNHRTNLMKKLNVHSVSELVLWAAKKGILK